MKESWNLHIIIIQQWRNFNWFFPAFYRLYIYIDWQIIRTFARWVRSFETRLFSIGATEETRSRNFCSQSCAHGTDKDVYMSVPCVLGREGVYARVRQELSEQEKTAIQRCADDIRNMLRECGILREPNDVEEWRPAEGKEESEKREGPARGR